MHRTLGGSECSVRSRPAAGDSYLDRGLDPQLRLLRTQLRSGLRGQSRPEKERESWYK